MLSARNDTKRVDSLLAEVMAAKNELEIAFIRKRNGGVLSTAGPQKHTEAERLVE